MISRGNLSDLSFSVVLKHLSREGYESYMKIKRLPNTEVNRGYIELIMDSISINSVYKY